MRSYSIHHFWPFKTGQAWVLALGTAGVLSGIATVQFLIPHDYSSRHKPAYVGVIHSAPTTMSDILNKHFAWAKEANGQALHLGMEPIRAFFDEAKRGTRGFGEDVLSFDSKWKMVTDLVSKEKKHRSFVERKFAERVFKPSELETVVQTAITLYMQRLDDVDSELLVRLEQDIAHLPSEALSVSIDRNALHQTLRQAMNDAVKAVQADFRGMIGRELVSFVAGEVLTVAATELAASAGIVGAGAYSGMATFGVGLGVGIAIDYVFSKAYESYFDPAGEISRQLNQSLDQMRNLIIDGTRRSPGLSSRLVDYASRRNNARLTSIQAVIHP